MRRALTMQVPLVTMHHVSLDQQLHALEQSELIRVVATQPDLAYLFRHALVQDAAYSSLVKTDRRALHRMVADVLERTFPTRLDELAPRLAEHCAEAGDAERALSYYQRAGDLAMRRYANGEAELHFTRALELARQTPDTAGDWRHLFTQRGRALELSGRFQDALTNYIDMQLLAHERGDQAMEIAALSARATLHSTHTPLHDPSQAEALSLETLDLARAMGDRAAETRLLWNLMLLNAFGGGGAQKARGYGEQSLTIAHVLAAVTDAPREAREQLAMTLKDLFYAHWMLGDMESARRVRSEALQLSRALNNRTMEAECLLGLGMVAFLAGEPARTDALLAEAYQISTSIHDPWGQAGARVQQGYVHAERGEVDDAFADWRDGTQLAAQAATFAASLIGATALALMYAALGAFEQALRTAERVADEARMQLPGWSAWPQATVARLHVRRGDLAAAAHIVGECCAGAKRDNFDRIYPVGAAEIVLADAELALAQHNFVRVVAVVDEALSIVQSSTRNLLPDLLCVKAQALWAMNQCTDAYALLREASAKAEAFQSRRALLFILPLLAEWAVQRGDESEARRWRERLREVVAFVSAHTSDAALRASFLNLSHVRAAALALP